jgi:hypothetical protein
MVAIVGADRMDQLVIDGSSRELIGGRPTAAVRVVDGAVEIAALQ